MPVAAFDTLKLAHLLHQAGHPRKTADGTASALQEVLGESYTSKSATIEAIETLGHSIDERFDGVDAGLAEVRKTQGEHTEALASLAQTMSDNHNALYARLGELLARIPLSK